MNINSNTANSANHPSSLVDGPSGLVSGGSGITEPFFSNYEEIASGSTHVLFRARRYGRWYVLKGIRDELRGNPLYDEWLYKEYSVGSLSTIPLSSAWKASRTTTWWADAS